MYGFFKMLENELISGLTLWKNNNPGPSPILQKFVSGSQTFQKEFP